jgi:hypothetical protein
VRKLKWFSSFKVSKDFLYSDPGEWRQNKIWWKWYSLTYLNTQNHLDTAVKYVNKNHLKHWVENILDIDWVKTMQTRQTAEAVCRR